MRRDPCLTYEELCAHPQVEANEMIITMDHPVRGEMKTLGVPIKLSKTRSNQPTRPAVGAA